jgi:hypothetical protein
MLDMISPRSIEMEPNLQGEIGKCMEEVEEFLRKKRLRYEEYIALGGPDCRILW